MLRVGTSGALQMGRLEDDKPTPVLGGIHDFIGVRFSFIQAGAMDTLLAYWTWIVRRSHMDVRTLAIWLDDDRNANQSYPDPFDETALDLVLCFDDLVPLLRTLAASLTDGLLRLLGYPDIMLNSYSSVAVSLEDIAALFKNSGHKTSIILLDDKAQLEVNIPKVSNAKKCFTVALENEDDDEDFVDLPSSSNEESSEED
ncbi:hypothetical protein QFC22_006725 [Naganishia vaughanmartiniae]|uniref:Uncharacterized protein n=1 Tax=Naganishia vaughanmartiniae TaxID=1424756 RepID=A0ACC2WH67_9TREE|nr:hypothetical protein QFC22_006725 [Naganishia vaughanmartiniae]